MKKVLFITGFILTSIIANAQWYVSGALSYETVTEKENKYSDTQFGISPQIGYAVNKKMDLGLSLEFSSSSNIQHFTFVNYDGIIIKRTYKNKDISRTIAPFLRYALFQKGDFEILGRVSLYFDITTNNSSEEGYATAESSIDNTGVGLNIGPVIQYNISDKISLFTSLNFFHFGLGFASLDDTITEPTSNTNFGLNLNFLNMNNLGIGVIYKF